MATYYQYTTPRPRPENDPNAAGPSTGPSTSSHRQASASGDQYWTWDAANPPRPGGGSMTDRDQFMDAVGDDDMGYAVLLGFEPAPPRVAQPQPSLRSPYEQQQSFRGTAHAGDAQTPPRQRLPTSTSMSSLSASLRGNRAPAPAALDLSPSSERTMRQNTAETQSNRYNRLEGLGMGPPPAMQAEGRRVVTDPLLDKRAARPLPVPPHATHPPTTSETPPAALLTSPSFPPGRSPPYRSSMTSDHSTSQRQPSYSTTASSTPHIPMSPSMPTMVPLSAVGHSRMGLRQSSISGSERLGVTTDDSRRPSIDSYYTRTSPSGATSLSPAPLAGSLSPTTPDPAQLDRRTLVGVGELATPRWTNTRTHPHLRTPSMPQNLGMSPTMPNPPESLHVGSAPSGPWSRGENGRGLGIGVMEGVQEESPLKERRHYSASMQTPPRPPPRRASKDAAGSKSKQESSSHDAFAGLLDLGSFGDFQFDTTMEAALAASLSIPEDPSPPRPPPPKKSSPQRQSAPPATNTPPRPDPPAAHTSTNATGPSARAQGMSYESLNPSGSPGSARSRIYARRAERERQAAAAAQAPDPHIPLRASSHQSPPNSADSNTSAVQSARDARKTPPTSRDGAPLKPRQSPSSAHHDILKHFAPKDFSHLPPSPSSASINQFLRGSGSVNNLGGMDSRSPLASQSNMQPSQSYIQYLPGSTMIPTAASKSSLQRSESGRMKSMASGSKVGWEGREVNRDAEEALRKLDGLGSTPGKKGTAAKGKQSTSSSSITSRPGTPVGKKASASSGQRASHSSVKTSDHPGKEREHDSPLNTWLDLSDDAPAPAVHQPTRGRVAGPKALPGAVEAPSAVDKRESSSSTSLVGTPNSRDSHSLPTSSTTPSSASGMRPDRSGRRVSGGSDVSQPIEHASPAAEAEKVGELHVPPVPPLPKGYMSMRQGLSNAAAAPAPIAYVPVQDPSPELHEVSSPSAPSINVPPSQSPGSAPPSAKPPMTKKWSFSSALSLKIHHKDSPSPVGSPSLPDPNDDGPQTPWTEILRQDLSTPSIVESVETLPGPSGYVETRTQDPSTASKTNATNNLAPPSSGTSGKPPTSHKRLTPSSIPFFRRASSSSIQSKSSQGTAPGVPETPKAVPMMSQATAPPSVTAQLAPSGISTVTRKSMLGMTLPSMLRGSASKRGLSQQLAPPNQVSVGTHEKQSEKDKVLDIKAEPKPVSSTAGTGSLGWTGRKRGKTLSISADASGQPYVPLTAPATPVHALKPKASVESTLSQRSSSNRSESTVNAATVRSSKSGLQPITGSPAIRHPPSTSSLRTSDNPSREAPRQTPTKIPRIASRSSGIPVQGGSMPPPAYPHTMSASRSANLYGPASATSRTMTNTTSMADLSRPQVSEFGAVNAPTTTFRQSTSGAHRAHLLAPMSSRPEAKRSESKGRDSSLVRSGQNGSGMPPSRRTLPNPPQPGSTAMAMTLSAQAKRSSREFTRPGNSRRSSKDTTSNSNGDEGSSDNTTTTMTATMATAMKPSKSMHSKLSVPTSSRIPSSSSMGAAGTGGTGLRKASLLPDSPRSSASPGDDEETLADAEMAAYVARRKSRASAGKKDDLADIEGFPDDTEPVVPMSARVYIGKNLANMSDFERKEVLDVDHIFYSPSGRISRPLQPGGAIYNHGYDDERGDYLVVPNDHLCYRYEVVSVLGKGSFGQVVQCRDHKTGASVAVKIIRNKKRFHAQALVEVRILEQLVEWDPEDKHYMVRMTDHFYFRSHLCIVTELLSINLYELIKANQFAGFSTVLIRRFTVQMLSSLALMRSHRIVHCDLKPENILLCHPSRSGIKVIDFGSSCLETEKVYTYIQSRFYRSPEVILGMNYAMAIDMWSLGCILAELYTGVPIFPGENEAEQLACIMEILGVPDRHIVEKASRRKTFFDATGAPRPSVNSKGKRRRPGSRTIAQALKCDDELFVDFIAKCLTWDPDKRLKPQPALRHPWILAGRRRAPPVPSSSSSSRPSSLVPGRSSRGLAAENGATGGGNSSGNGNGSGNGTGTGTGNANGYSGIGMGGSPSMREREKKRDGQGQKSLLISPPTPLMARQNHSYGIPLSAPRMTGGGSALRLANGQVRSSNYIGGKGSMG